MRNTETAIAADLQIIIPIELLVSVIFYGRWRGERIFDMVL